MPLKSAFYQSRISNFGSCAEKKEAVEESDETSSETVTPSNLVPISDETFEDTSFDIDEIACVDLKIISEIKEIIGKIQLSYENTMSLIYAILYDYTKKGLYQHRCVYPAITMNKSMYINSVHIRTTNPYYKKIYMYKNILAGAKYDDKVEEHSVDFATYIQKGNTLDVYFIQMIKKRYPDDVISVDHIIDNHLNITSPSIHMNDTTNDCMNHPFSSTVTNEHKSII